MHSTAEINAIVNDAKQRRADYIGSMVQATALPIALAALLALVQFAGGPSQDQVQQSQVVDDSAQNG